MRSPVDAPLGAATFQSPIARTNADSRALQHIHASLEAEGRAVIRDTDATAPRDSTSRMAEPLLRSSRRKDNPEGNQDWFTEADYGKDKFTFQILLAESGKPFYSEDNNVPNRLHRAA